jgi:hypothetical protein
MLELINICRPMPRDHALATSLAEYEPEVAALPSLIPSPASVGGSSLDCKEMDDGESFKAPKPRSASSISIYQQLCSSLHLNGPTPDAVVRDVKLEHILRHPVTLELFKDIMIRDHCSENLTLYLDIRRYKTTNDAQLRGLLAREIHETSVARGSIYEVNVSDAMRKVVESKSGVRPTGTKPVPLSLLYLKVLSPFIIGGAAGDLGDYLPTPVDLFQPIEEELLKLRQANNWPRFVGTPAFNLCALILNRPQYKLTNQSGRLRGGGGAGGAATVGSGRDDEELTASAAHQDSPKSVLSGGLASIRLGSPHHQHRGSAASLMASLGSGDSPKHVTPILIGHRIGNVNNSSAAGLSPLIGTHRDDNNEGDEERDTTAIPTPTSTASIRLLATSGGNGSGSPREKRRLLVNNKINMASPPPFTDNLIISSYSI